MKHLLLIALVLLTLPAAATEHFVYLRGGEIFGEEQFNVTTRGDTTILEGFTSLHKPQPRRWYSRTRLLGPDERPLDYLFWTDEGDSIRSRVEGDQVNINIASSRFREERDFPLAGSKLMFLDNSVSQHLWLLARQIMRDREGERALAGAIPQQLYFSAIEFREIGLRPGKIGDDIVEVHNFDVNFAGILNEMDIDQEGNFRSFRIPVQGMEIREARYRSWREKVKIPEFTQESISFKSGDLTVEGSLTLPKGEGPFPVTLLLHPTGAIDRDMTFGPNQIFYQLAAGLADRGIASLRYDKRTAVTTEGEGSPYMDKTLTLQEEVLDDALAAYRYLAFDDRFDPEHIYLLGHSLGAAAAPTLSKLLQAEGEIPAGLVMMAPPGRDLLSVIHEQNRFLHQRGLIPDELMARDDHAVANYREGKVGADNVIFFAKPRYWDSVNFWSPWDDYLEQSSPALILFAEQDYMTLGADQRTWDQTFASDMREGCEIELAKGLNHIFLPATGVLGPEEFAKRGLIPEKLLDRIANWMLRF